MTDKRGKWKLLVLLTKLWHKLCEQVQQQTWTPQGQETTVKIQPTLYISQYNTNMDTTRQEIHCKSSTYTVHFTLYWYYKHGHHKARNHCKSSTHAANLNFHINIKYNTNMDTIRQKITVKHQPTLYIPHYNVNLDTVRQVQPSLYISHYYKQIYRLC